MVYKEITMIRDRVPPRDDERIDGDHCPDCFHLFEECACPNLSGEVCNLAELPRGSSAPSAQSFPECSSAHPEPNTQQGQITLLSGGVEGHAHSLRDHVSANQWGSSGGETGTPTPSE